MIKKLLIVSALTAGFLAACRTSATTHIDVELRDYTITPNQLVLPAGSPVEITISNLGDADHNFYIMKYGTDVGDKFTDEAKADAYWHAQLAPGETGTYYFTAPAQPGTYQIVCGMPGHIMAGMYATLKITAITSGN